MLHRNLKTLFALSASILYTLGCTSKKAALHTPHHWHDSGNYLVKRTFSPDGQLEREQTFTKDTIPHGTDTRYHTNGNIGLWRFFTNTVPDTMPLCAITFDSNANFEKMYGNPFKGTIWKKKDCFLILAIRPPFINAKMVLDVFRQEKCIKRLLYEIDYNDTLGYVFVGAAGELKFKKDHRYILEYLIFDSKDNEISKAPKAMQIEEKGYTLVPPPIITKIWPE